MAVIVMCLKPGKSLLEFIRNFIALYIADACNSSKTTFALTVGFGYKSRVSNDVVTEKVVATNLIDSRLCLYSSNHCGLLIYSYNGQKGEKNSVWLYVESCNNGYFDNFLLQLGKITVSKLADRHKQ